ncbi:unnamed protein product [Camellia sinensis]
MLSKASSSKFYRIFFFFWFIMLMFIILQPITSARKLAGNGPGSKMGVRPSPTTHAPSAVGVRPSPTTHAPSAIGVGGGGHSPRITYSALKKTAVCNKTLYGNCIAHSNAPPRPCTTYSRCKSTP